MEAGPSRKRLRRSTRSCFQCRKRKVKCQLTDEDVETCAECVKSGIQCTIQPPPPETGFSSESPLVHSEKQENESRLERIEALLKKLVEAQEGSRVVEGSLESDEPGIPASLWNDFLVQSTADGTLPLIDNGLVTPQPSEVPDTKQSLVALLPSAQDAANIVTNTTAWLWGAETPRGSVLHPTDTVRLLDVASISAGSPIHIAKTLLLFALYMQQLPASFDGAHILSSQTSVIEQVKLYVLSHEEEDSLDGIECLTLLYTLQLNDGALRKAWMTLRRTLDTCRLQGLQNSFSPSSRATLSTKVALRRRLWLSAVCGDCYCSLLLGLEPALGIAPFGPDDDDDDEPWIDPLAGEEASIQRRIGLVAARIAQRNVLGMYRDRNTLREVDESLDRVENAMPMSWWRAPVFSRDRSLDSAREPNRLVCQLWFFQVRMFAHLPFAFLGSASTTSMDTSMGSLEICTEAARITLHRYLGLQHARDQLSRCRTVEQSAFISAVILLLATFQLRHVKKTQQQQRFDSDRALLEQVIDSFEYFAKACSSSSSSSREHVARESFEILSTMLSIATTTTNSEDGLFASSPDHNTSLVLLPGTSSSLEGAVDSTTKSGMQDIIASSIHPALDPTSPASHLINQFFATRRPASDPSQELIT